MLRQHRIGASACRRVSASRTGRSSVSSACWAAPHVASAGGFRRCAAFDVSVSPTAAWLSIPSVAPDGETQVTHGARAKVGAVPRIDDGASETIGDDSIETSGRMFPGHA